MTVKQITDPNGKVWKVGDPVLVYDPLHQQPPRQTRIAGIHPGNGSWARKQPYGDHEAVWFALSDGWMARPWLVRHYDV